MKPHKRISKTVFCMKDKTHKGSSIILLVRSIQIDKMNTWQKELVK
jgi:hypothetical protein